MDKSQRKRLGQFFSGNKVAELLISFCSLTGTETVIDPMAGTGDMLVAAVKHGVAASNVYGIEIDKAAAAVCSSNLQAGQILCGDAFSSTPMERFGMDSWDLVITNPPYVRYQTMKNIPDGESELKNASEVRNDLGRIVESLDHLSAEEKECFQCIIKNYSGLSDLAVPSWLLCAALVNRGGILAMVVPESWINRDYAISVKYLLLKLFRIKYIIEDLNAAWFHNVQVKTNLVIARRTHIHNIPLSRRSETYIHIRLSAGMVGDKSLVDNLEYAGSKAMSALQKIASAPVESTGNGYEISRIAVSDFIYEMSQTQGFNKLIHKFEPYSTVVHSPSIPRYIRDAIGLEDYSDETASISDWGFNVGQGLRTGANRFFYTELINSDEEFDYLKADEEIYKKTLAVSHSQSVPVLRYQADIYGRYRVTKGQLAHRLLYISETYTDDNGMITQESDKQLAEYIAIAEDLSITNGGRSIRIPELSAVKPNERVLTINGKTVQRRWFMIPKLTNRHVPQLCISRVNYKSPRCMLVNDAVVVDANFSTLWTADFDMNRVYAVLALMNSSWVKAYLECVASVMGGGALKVEASHLRQIRLPKPKQSFLEAMAQLGRQLANSDIQNDSATLQTIDKMTLGSIICREISYNDTKGLRDLIHAKLDARKR